MTTSKNAHLYTFFLIFLAAYFLVYLFPDIWNSNVTKFATIGFFITFYGVVFTIVEVIRTKSATQLVSDESGKILRKVDNLAGLRLLNECQAAIDLAIRVIDNRGKIPLSMLTTILKIYTEHFHKELEDPKSTHRRNSAMLQSFAEASPKREKLNNLSNIRRTFAAMTMEISTEIARKSKNGVVE